MRHAESLQRRCGNIYQGCEGTGAVGYIAERPIRIKGDSPNIADQIISSSIMTMHYFGVT